MLGPNRATDAGERNINLHWEGCVVKRSSSPNGDTLCELDFYSRFNLVYMPSDLCFSLAGC